MVECKDFDDKLLDYLYEELPVAERQAYEQHLAGCARCQGELGSFGGVRRAAQQLELAEPPAAVSAKLMYQAAQLAPRRRGGKVLPLVRKLWQHPAYAMAACFLIVGGVTSWQLIVHGELPMPAPALQGKPAEQGGRGETEAVPAPVAAATPEATAQAPAAPAEAAAEPKSEPMPFDKKGSKKAIASPSKGLSEDSAKELEKAPASLSGAAPKTALAQEGYRPASSTADGDSLLDSLGGVSKKMDKGRSGAGAGAGDSLSLKNERPATVLAGKASRGAANDDAPALPEIQRPAQEAASGVVGGAPTAQTVQLPLGKDQNQQLARDTLPQPPETRSRAAKPSPVVKPGDRELQVLNERNSATSGPAAPSWAEAGAPAGAGAPAPPPNRVDNNLAQGQALAHRLAGNVGEDAICREVELRIQTEGQARVPAEDLWADYLCLKRRGQAASARAQGDLRRLASEFPSFRSDEVVAERRENEASDERNQRQLEGWEQPQRAKKAKRAAPRQSEGNKAY